MSALAENFAKSVCLASSARGVGGNVQPEACVDVTVVERTLERRHRDVSVSCFEHDGDVLHLEVGGGQFADLRRTVECEGAQKVHGQRDFDVLCRVGCRCVGRALGGSLRFGGCV